MKKFTLLLLAISTCFFLQAQSVGIGTTSPNASAMLEISSANKGLLLPRLADTSSVISPVKGLVIYSNSNNKLWYYDGTRWQQTAANAGGTDGIWYKANDTVAYTTTPYVGINTDTGLIAPQANLQVTGGLLVQGKLSYSKAAPTAGQTYTMTNTASFQNIPNTDSVFRIYDPGGTGNYNNNMQGNVTIGSSSNSAGFKVTSVAADWGFGTGDTLWISESTFPFCRTNYEYRFTSTTPNPGEFIMKLSSRFNFRSNSDGVNNKGFQFSVVRLFNSEPDVKINAGGPALYYNTSTNSFSAGSNCDAGSNSVAMGSLSKADASSFTFGTQTRAVGNSIAMGYLAEALGSNSIALGTLGYNVSDGYERRTIATSPDAVAIGAGVVASGSNAMALGEGSTATGTSSLAVGYNTLASGVNATAIGTFTQATGFSATSMGFTTSATGSYSTSIGYNTTSNGYAGTVVGMYNFPVVGAAQTSASANTPLFIVGNGELGSLSNAMVVLKSGNVGIGNLLPPVTKLQIDGGTDASLSNNSGYLVVGDVNSTNLVMDVNEIIARNNGVSTTLFLQNEGGALETGGTAAKPGGGSWAATSDARLKENVTPYADGLQQLLKINPVYYHYNQQSGYDTKKQYVGVLAQELNEIAPYMVGTFKKDNTEFLNVDNSAMTYMLINAVKEQQKQIEELKALVDKLVANTSK